jgi:hypothetical protein
VLKSQEMGVQTKNSSFDKNRIYLMKRTRIDYRKKGVGAVPKLMFSTTEFGLVSHFHVDHNGGAEFLIPNESFPSYPESKQPPQLATIEPPVLGYAGLGAGFSNCNFAKLIDQLCLLIFPSAVE